MSTSDERAKRAEDKTDQLRKRVEQAKSLKENRKSNQEIADELGISESSVRSLLAIEEINWGYNCLTVGVHHGRPEALWNMPLFQAWMIFSEEDLRQLVVARIYQDALQFVEHGDPMPGITKQWAEQIKQYAGDWFHSYLQRKVEEIGDYYKSSSWQSDIKLAIGRLEEDKLNPGYKPLHGHDSINMLCRILGTSCSREASKDFG